MKIEFEGSLIKLIPENDRERSELDQLWKKVVSCIKDDKKLVPLGEYIPGIKEIAYFNME